MGDETKAGAGTGTPDTSGQESKAQAVSIEQLEATRTELAAAKQALEDIKKAQQGSDQKVAKLLAELEQKETKSKTAEERIAEIERKAADAEARAARQEWLNAGYKEAAARGLPARLVDSYGGDPAKLKDFLDAEKAEREELVNNARKERMVNEGHRPAGATGTAGAPDIKNMSHNERLKHFTAEAERRTGGQKD
jgi:chromosome segregation ATPase